MGRASTLEVKPVSVSDFLCFFQKTDAELSEPSSAVVGVRKNLNP